jgi:excisionase family DNA binding protein
MTSVPLQISDEFYETIARRVTSHVADTFGHSAEWLTVAQAALHLQTSQDGIRALIKRNKIPHHRAAGRILFDRAELDAWVRGELKSHPNLDRGPMMGPTDQMPRRSCHSPGPA